MIQIKDNTSRNLSAICLQHYNSLKPLVARAINSNVPVNQRAYLITNLQKILTGKPDELLKLHNNYRAFCSRKRTRFNMGIKKAFSYDNFIVRKSYSIYHLADRLQVDVCPYCNRQYTFTVISGNKKITRPEFDHFFSQENYPLLALSFYNLIPSCVICNSRLKGSIKFSLTNHLHPYLAGFDKDLLFNYKVLTPNGGTGFTDEIQIGINISKTSTKLKQIQGNCNVFQTEEIFKQHKDHVREIIRKHYVSGGKYLKILAKTFPALFTSSEEVYQLALGNYFKESDFLKRPLSKLYKDIYENLKFDSV